MDQIGLQWNEFREISYLNDFVALCIENVYFGKWTTVKGIFHGSINTVRDYIVSDLTENYSCHIYSCN